MFVSRLSEFAQWRLQNGEADALTVVRAVMDAMEDYTAGEWSYAVEQREDTVAVRVLRKAHENTVPELTGALTHRMDLDVTVGEDDEDTILIPLDELPEGVA